MNYGDKDNTFSLKYKYLQRKIFFFLYFCFFLFMNHSI